MPNKREMILEEVIISHEATKIALHKAWYKAYTEVASEIMLLEANE